MASTNNSVRLRQIALVVKDLKRAEYLLTHVLGSEVIFRDPAVGQWGLENILVPIGGDIIEVVSPIQPDNTASRLLSKRGDGGYMLIMQTNDASGRRVYLESNKLAKVIFSHEEEGFVCVQYHPKGIKGGMLPELDSQLPTPNNPYPVTTRFSPWYACGNDYTSYSAAMKRHSDLQFIKASCRLAPGDSDTGAAARQWEGLFNVPQSEKVGELEFTNMQLRFTEASEGEHEGLEWITIRVGGEKKFNGILERASEEGLCGDGWINMLGVKWLFELVKIDDESKL